MHKPSFLLVPRNSPIYLWKTFCQVSTYWKKKTKFSSSGSDERKMMNIFVVMLLLSGILIMIPVQSGID